MGCRPTGEAPFIGGVLVLKHIARRVLEYTPYEVKRRKALVSRLPDSTLEVVRLAMAYYLATAPAGAVLQIGACDGVSGDPLFDFVRQGRLRAIVVEPIASSAAKLRETYRDFSNVTIVQAAVAHVDGPVSMFRVRNAGRWSGGQWHNQIASFDRQHLIRHRITPDEIEEVEVEGVSLHTLLRRTNCHSVEFLQVDAEGFDADVVGMALKLRIAPDYINFEHAHLQQRAAATLFEELQRQEYTWIHGRYDTLAIHARVLESMSVICVREGEAVTGVWETDCR
jgi:FkbM family methyltransferase